MSLVGVRIGATASHESSDLNELEHYDCDKPGHGGGKGMKLTKLTSHVPDVAGAAEANLGEVNAVYQRVEGKERIASSCDNLGPRGHHMAYACVSIARAGPTVALVARVAVIRRYPLFDRLRVHSIAISPLSLRE